MKEKGRDEPEDKRKREREGEKIMLKRVDAVPIMIKQIIKNMFGKQGDNEH